MSEDAEATDHAWRIHGAVADWTGKAETKASFALAVETAVLGGIVALTGGHHRLAHLHGSALGLFWAGMVLIILGLLAVVGAVVPRLRTKDLEAEAPTNLIYFGHLKYWRNRDDELAEALRKEPILPMLSKQLVETGRIAWQKHRLLQVSMLAACIGSALVAIAAAVR